jgi:ABC-type antimicrobial peptide transport system permease subunit
MSTVLIGLAVGLLGAFALTRVMESLLFGVSALDPAALAIACAAMALIGLLAALLPARLAASVEPMTVLRDEG